MSALSGMVFCVTGALSVVRREFERFLKDQGGVVRPRMTQEVTHLICSDMGTSKAKRALKLGATIWTEAQVRALVANSHDDSEQESDEQESDEHEEWEETSEHGNGVEKIRYKAPETLSAQKKQRDVLADVENVADVSSLPSDCTICLCPFLCEDAGNEATKPRISRLRCGHAFHHDCLKQAMEQHKPVCPVCRKPISEPQGTCPSGTMEIETLEDCPCPGFKHDDGTDVNAIQIQYHMPGGIQKQYHYHPGVRFGEDYRVAYLPDNREGRDLLERLIYAWSHGLIFTIGTSLTTHIANTIVWSSIHHKTSLCGGAYSFPDPGYIMNCNESLDALYVPDAVSCKAQRKGEKCPPPSLKPTVDEGTEMMVDTLDPAEDAKPSAHLKTTGSSSDPETSTDHGSETSAASPAKDNKKHPNNSKDSPAPKKAKIEELDSLADGEERQVEGKDYTMKNVGGIYSCTCPAWRFQSQTICSRTCKHLQELRGEAAEAARIGSTTTTSKPITLKAKKAASKAKGGALFDAGDLMLAHKWDGKKQANNYLMSEKLDGMRALWNGKELVSRQGNPIDAPDFFLEGFPSDTALDGELFLGRGEFQATVSITKRLNGGERWRKIQFVVFDAPAAEGGFEDRLKTAEAAVAQAEFATVLKHEPCQGDDHLTKELERVEKLGGEGLMMREKGSAYQHGRSQKLLKVKTFVDDEAIVYGHAPGTGKHSGRMGALLCRLRNGTEFKVGSGFTDQQRESPPPVDTVITIKYFELTKAGVPRFPTFQRVRVDVEASEFA